MQEELRIAFLAIGIVFIIGLLAHGAWTVRKNKRASRPNNFQSGRSAEPRFGQSDNSQNDIDEDDDIYDDVGVGQARVISSNTTQSTVKPSDIPSKSVPIISADDLRASSSTFSARDSSDEEAFEQGSRAATNINIETTVDDDIEDEAVSSSHIHGEDEALLDSDIKSEGPNLSAVNTNTSDNKSSSPVYSGVVTQPKPGLVKQGKLAEEGLDTSSIPAPPDFLLKKNDAEKKPVDETEQSAHSSVEPKSDDKNLDNDFSLNVQEGPEKPAVQAKQEPEKLAGVEKELSFAQQAKRFVTRRKKTVAEKIRKDPVVKGSAKEDVDQMRIDFDKASRIEPALHDGDGVNEAGQANQSEPASSQSGGGDAPQTDVLVLNVKASADNPIKGAALLPMLLTLGFKFGEHDIFHRHVNTNGKGPILFSLTNMFKPGVFDIDNIENFNTQGVSLFMMLPIEGEAQQVFNMMHNASRKIAEEFDCKILDGNKALLSKQSLQHYSERIRDFERRRLSR